MKRVVDSNGCVMNSDWTVLQKMSSNYRNRCESAGYSSSLDICISILLEILKITDFCNVTFIKQSIFKIKDPKNYFQQFIMPKTKFIIEESDNGNFVFCHKPSSRLFLTSRDASNFHNQWFKKNLLFCFHSDFPCEVFFLSSEILRHTLKVIAMKFTSINTQRIFCFLMM